MAESRIYSIEEACGLELDEIVDLHRRYVNETLIDIIDGYGIPRRFVKAEGIRLWDDTGTEYLDFLCSYGALALGHNHPEILAAGARVHDQPNFFVLSPGAITGALASSLAAICPGNLERSFFCNSGSEAVEGALKLARAATGRHHIVAAQEGFHGKSLGALSVTGHDAFKDVYRPLLADVSHVPFGDADAVGEQLRASPVAAVILEPIQGPAGIIVPPSGYLEQVRESCTKHGALLILDEIQTGLGRTGRMFACDHDAVVPDVICISKGLSGGVYPIGAYVTTDRIWRKAYATKKRAALHTSTFGGNTFACAAALAAINITLRDDLPGRAADLGAYFHARLADLADRFEMLAEVRGRGLMVGLDFTPRGTRLTRSIRQQTAAMIAVQMLHRHNIISLYTFANADVVRLAPPLTVEKTDLDRYVDALEEVLSSNRRFTNLAFKTTRAIRSHRR